MTNAVQRQLTSPSTVVQRPHDCFHGYSDPRHGTRVHCIYFYYVKSNGDKIVYLYDNGEGVNDHIRSNDLIGILTSLTDSAAAGGTILPPRTVRFNPKSEKLRRRAYIAVVLDIPDWEFNEDDPISYPIGNISMYNASISHKIQILREPRREVPLFYCINHLKKNLSSDRDLEPHQRQPFELRFHPARQAFEAVLADGTNLGPPVPPPRSSGFLKWLIQNLLRRLRALVGH